MISPTSPALKKWHDLYADQEALIQSPERHQHDLITLAEALRAKEVISDDELSDLFEQADAAYQWGIEEQLTRGLLI
ncbi:hypothetical protein [Pseudomonas helleri]|uniref:hypothetical protein n=1 Tax=Pseudomonas helleri TaxID=1608996 RepID=UPI003FD1DD53